MLECLYVRSGLTVHKEMYAEHIQNYKNALFKAKSDYYSNIIGVSNGNSRLLFSMVNNFLRPPDSLPSDMYSTDLCDRFMTFFESTVKNVHQQLLNSTFHHDSCQSISYAPPHSVFSTFTLPTASEIVGLINTFKSSTCQLEPLPTPLVKACLPELSPLITKIVNASLVSGSVPSLFKSAIITPILKKSGADPFNFDNFRPISNLPFISKIIEKCIAIQIQEHLSNNN